MRCFYVRRPVPARRHRLPGDVDMRLGMILYRDEFDSFLTSTFDLTSRAEGRAVCALSAWWPLLWPQLLWRTRTTRPPGYCLRPPRCGVTLVADCVIPVAVASHRACHEH